MLLNENSIIYNALLRLFDNGELLSAQQRWELLREVIKSVCAEDLNEIMGRIETKYKLQIKRGNQEANDGYTGLPGEITMDTTNNTIRLHDGTTRGGHLINGAAPAPQQNVWISGEFMPEMATRTIATHNLGLDPMTVSGDVLLKCVSDDAGYQAGEYCSNWTPSGKNNGLSYPIAHGVTITENTIETTTGADTIAALAKNCSDQYIFLEHTNWRYVFRIFY